MSNNENLHPWLQQAAAAGFIMTPKSLIHKLGIEEAILFSEILQREHYFKERDMLTKDGFFFNTNKDMSSGTGISERKLKKLYETLQSYDLIEISLRGMPKRTHIRICYENEFIFNELLQESIELLYEKEEEARARQIGTGVARKLREDYEKKKKTEGLF